MPFYENDVDKTKHVIMPQVFATLPTDVRAEMIVRRLYLAVDQENDLFIWETGIPDPVAPNAWVTSGERAVLEAAKRWVRIVPRKKQQRYDFVDPVDPLPDPVRPDIELEEAIELGYQGRIVTDVNDPAVAHLFGKRSW